MIVNPDVDGYTTLITRKHSENANNTTY